MKTKYLVFFIILLIVIFAGCVGEKTGEQVSTLGASKGKDIYLANCAGCHGPQGRGDGPMASNLPTPPKDLTIAKGKSDAELKSTIKEGIMAMGMPAFEGALSDEEVQYVTEFLRIL